MSADLELLRRESREYARWNAEIMKKIHEEECRIEYRRGHSDGLAYALKLIEGSGEEDEKI